MEYAYSVIIAEDNPAVANALRDLLQELGHNVVGMTLNGDNAMSIVARLKPDVAIIDLELEGRNGLDLALSLMHKMRTPVVLCTADADHDTLTKALQAGIRSYLVKPFRSRELMAAIHLSCRQFEEQYCSTPRRNCAFPNCNRLTCMK